MPARDEALSSLFATVFPHLNERQRRILAAAQARALGWGGIAAVAEASGMSRSTVQKAVRELDEGLELSERVREPGGGRKSMRKSNPRLVKDLESLVDPATRGDPESPLRWTSKSTYQLADALAHKGHEVSHDTIASILHELGYSLQANLKTREGQSHPDRVPGPLKAWSFPASPRMTSSTKTSVESSLSKRSWPGPPESMSLPSD